MIGKSQTTFYTQKEDSLIQQNEKKEEAKWNANIAPEKVHDLIPEAYRDASNRVEYPGIRTAFYAQVGKDEVVAAESKEGEKTEEKGEKKQNEYATELKTGAIGANSAPEKVHVLETPIAKTHTTFYLGKSSQTALQTEDANIGPEKIHVLQTKHATSHTTYFDKENGLWRQDVDLV